MGANTPPSEEDDLFNFDQLDTSAKYAAAAAKPAAPATAKVAAPAAAKSAAAPAPLPRAAAPIAKTAVMPAPVAAPPRAEPAPALPGAPAPVTTVPAGELPLRTAAPSTLLVQERKEPARQVAPARRAPASTSAVRAAAMFTAGTLALAAFVNLTLAGVVWKSMTGLDKALAGGALGGAQLAPRDAAPSFAARVAESLPPTPDEGELALAAATEEIHRGEFERARARIYSLLAVIDRFDGPARARLASRAQVLAADSFREQADALEARREETDPRAGFIEPPAEGQR